MIRKSWQWAAGLGRAAFDRVCGRTRPAVRLADIDRSAKEELESAVTELREALQRFGRVVEHTVEPVPEPADADRTATQ